MNVWLSHTLNVKMVNQIQIYVHLIPLVNIQWIKNVYKKHVLMLLQNFSVHQYHHGIINHILYVNGMVVVQKHLMLMCLLKLNVTAAL